MSELSDYRRCVSDPLERELRKEIAALHWQVSWLVAQARDERLTPLERVGIIAHFPSKSGPDEARATTDPNDRIREELND